MSRGGRGGTTGPEDGGGGAKAPGDGGRGPLPVSEASLFSYLVTRHTGRAVRLSLEEQITACGDRVLAVLDFGDVAVIDFSCADEIVAKLVQTSQGPASRADGGAPPGRPPPGRGGGSDQRFFFFRGLREHHMDPIESALARRALAVSAERSDGSHLLLGPVEGHDRRAWLAVQELGRARMSRVARRLGLPRPAARRALERLHHRRLVLWEASEYVSLHHALRAARVVPGSGD